MKVPLTIQSLGDIFWRPSKFFLNIPRLDITSAMVLAYTVLVLVMLSCSALTYQVQLEQRLVDFQKKGVDISQAAANGVDINEKVMLVPRLFSLHILFKPFVLAALIWLVSSLVKPNFPCQLSLLIALFAEVLYGAGRILTASLANLTHSLEISLSLAPVAKMLGLNDNSSVVKILANLDVFFFWELLFLALGFAIIFKCTTKRGWQMSVLSLGLLKGIYLGIVLWWYS